ncbi:MAG TPA: deoxyribonuclease IV [Candidatus Paceibacterota bacterium]|nr:deoxyribonuclease IV [Candidatus Paceibacterota bacterium]
MFKIGAHVSAAGGLYKCVENALAIGAEAIQIFGSSPRQWRVTLPSADSVKLYKTALEKSGIKDVFLHAPYLINLASPDEATWQNSVNNLAGSLQISELMEANGVIFHVGSGKDSDRAPGLTRAITGMKAALKMAPGKTHLIIENSASAKKAGADTPEIAYLMNGVDDKRVKVCIDTAHAFEAGWVKDYSPQEIDRLMDDLEKNIGLSNILAVHVNDSKTAQGSNHDQHDNIGEGQIGLEGFKNLAKEKRLWDKPWLLEVPGFEDMGPDKKNIDILKKLRDGK